MRKKADERKKEILDAADILFTQKGFDGTSTNDILEKVGIARGALYHHFKSKEEILDSLIDRYSTRLLCAAKLAAEDKEVPLIKRIIYTIQSLNVNNAGGGEILRQIHKPQNALMHEKSHRAMLQGIPPILESLVQEGIDQGIFNTPYPYQCMEMVVAYINAVFDDESTSTVDNATLLQAFIFNIERLLGAEPGSLLEIAQTLQTGNDN